jgi:huntingtin-interacting protein 1-related protein
MLISSVAKAHADSSSQPILADEVQTFKALITIHKVLQEGHPIVLKEAQGNVGWLESLRRGVVNGEGVRGW